MATLWTSRFTYIPSLRSQYDLRFTDHASALCIKSHASCGTGYDSECVYEYVYKTAYARGVLGYWWRWIQWMWRCGGVVSSSVCEWNEHVDHVWMIHEPVVVISSTFLAPSSHDGYDSCDRYLVSYSGLSYATLLPPHLFLPFLPPSLALTFHVVLTHFVDAYRH